MDENNIGNKRLEYLDLANKMKIQGNYEAVKESIISFQNTIRNGSQIADEINKEFTRIQNEKNEKYRKIVEETQNIDTQLQAERRYYAWYQELPLDELDKQLDVCWQILMKYKLHLPSSD